MQLSLRDRITGLATNRRPNPGETKQCLNWLLGLNEGALRCETRPYSRRVQDVFQGAQVESMGEIPNDDGTYFKLAKLPTTLSEFTTASGSLASVQAASFQTYPVMVSGFDKLFICDETDGNFVWDGTTIWPLVEQTAAATPTISASALAAPGIVAGVFEYQFSYASSTKGWEKIPHAPIGLQGRLGFQVTAVTDKGIDLPDLSGNHSGIYDRTRWYRRLRNTNQWYLVAENATAVTDTVAEIDLTAGMLSEMHDNDTGLVDATIPAASPTAAMHKGRLHLADKDETLWSKAGLPFIFRNTSTHKFQENTDDVMALVSYRESLVVFKRRSIWLMSGDVNETNFTFFNHTPRLGLFGRRTWTATPAAILFFGSDREFYQFTFDPHSTDAPLRSSASVHFGPGAPVLGATGRVDFGSIDDSDSRIHSAGWDPLEKMAVFCLKTEAGPFVTAYLATDGMVIGQLQWEDGEARLVREMHDGNSEADGNERCLYIGDDAGFISRTFDRTQTADAVPSGTEAGTVTGGTSTTLTDSAASFYQGSGLSADLKNIEVTKKTVAGVIETQTIITNTATVLTVASWTANPVAGDTYTLGNADFRLWLGGVDAGMSRKKRFSQVSFGFQPGVGVFAFGATDTEESTIEASNQVEVAGDVATQNLVHIYPNSRAFRISPYVKGFLQAAHCSIDDITLEFTPMRRTL